MVYYGEDGRMVKGENSMVRTSGIILICQPRNTGIIMIRLLESGQQA